ncbi:MAG: hypothetical protein COV44_08230 [Deltaproteobacteria bacterium CG11_big_fil_rev_8_21_14_0_20_45_16]|nr:MAG: hypothetical protein COV44_08230 [Deltaproteobacteria bacterium CG11_big_fil_rev_8_21_14_0_20_45_16]
MDKSQINILIVEDEKDISQICREFLESAGYKNIENSSNGMDGLNKALTAQKDGKAFDLIISDWDMPIMTGLQLLEKIRENSQVSNTLVILISGKCSEEVIRQAVKFQVSGIILKPFEKDVLNAKVDSLFVSREIATEIENKRADQAN